MLDEVSTSTPHHNSSNNSTSANFNTNTNTSTVALKLSAVSRNSRLFDRRAVATTTRTGDAADIFIVSASGVTRKDEQDKVETLARTFTAI